MSKPSWCRAPSGLDIGSPTAGIASQGGLDPFETMRAHILSVLAASPFMFNRMPSNPVSQGQPRKLVVVLAHADDEIAAGPVLARYAREGVEVHLIVASDGSAGSGSSGAYLVRPDSTPKGDSLVLQRQAEAAGEIIGRYAAALLDSPLPWTRMRRVYALLGLVRR